MGLFSSFFKSKKTKPSNTSSNKPTTNNSAMTKADRGLRDIPESFYHNLPSEIDMNGFSLAGAFRIDLILLMGRISGDGKPFDGMELLYDVMLEDGVINVPLVMFKEGKKYGFFAFYSEMEASNFKKFKNVLTTQSDFKNCYYISSFNPEKYAEDDGILEKGTSFNAILKLDKEGTDKTFEGHYAMWWSTSEDPHFGSSKTKEYYHTIYENLDGFESIFIGMLVNSWNNKDEFSRVRLPDEERIFYCIGPENKKCLISLSQEKGFRILLNRQIVSTEYRHRLLRLVAKSIKFLKAGFKEREIPMDEKIDPKPIDYYNFLSQQISEAKVVAEAIAPITIGTPPPIIHPRDEGINEERLVIRIKIQGDITEDSLTLPEEQQPVIFPFQEDILIGIAQDMGHSYEFVNNNLLADSGKDKKELANIGIANILKEIGDKIKVQGDPNDSHIMIACGGNHESALLVVNDFWNQIGDFIKSDFCVCFPVRDILLAANFYNEKAMDNLRTAIKNFYYNPEQPFKLSNGIYLRKEGTWKLIERIEND